MIYQIRDTDSGLTLQEGSDPWEALLSFLHEVFDAKPEEIEKASGDNAVVFRGETYFAVAR